MKFGMIRSLSLEICFFFSFYLEGVCFGQMSGIQHEPEVFVNPYIGSGGHGHVFVGASVPHGMVQLGPNNHRQGWDWCSGYHYSDTTIVGFALTHLSGTGIADLGDILFLPVDSVIDLDQPNYLAYFDRKDESVRPGYYSVRLQPSNIQVELTATPRTGFQRYVYPSNVEKGVVIDLEEAPKSLNSRQGVLESSLTLLNDTTLIGYRISDEWAKGHQVFFATIFSQPIRSMKVHNPNSKQTTENSYIGKAIRGYLNFDKSNDQPLCVKTGISYVSVKNALENLSAEGENKTFDKIKEQSRCAWNDVLGKIDFYSSDPHSMKIFYTALYHTHIVPSLFMDVNGEYLGADGKIHRAKDFTPYTVFSLWDTYRALHPFYSLIHADNADYIKSLLAITRQQKSLPIWHLVGHETECMVGVHSIPVIVDAVLKGSVPEKKRETFRLLRGFAQRNDRGLKLLRTRGYIPADQEEWSVAKALEYAVDDYAIAALADQLHQEKEAHRFYQRSKGYASYFDAHTGFMRGKLGDGSWRTPFDPFHSVHLHDDYVEGNAWQYTWLVPHDVEGLIALFGGDEPFLHQLDSLFLVPSQLNEGASADITGLIGQYAHGNEPSHHILYLYPYAGQCWKTQEKVREVYDRFYQDTPDGLIGNEDCGQMSAWLIFSAIGFYPVNPVDGIYVFGSPLAEKATLHLTNGRQMQIQTLNYSKTNKYIQSVTLNGQAYEKSFISHEELMKGGKLVFTMSPYPNKNFGFSKENRPYSKLNYKLH